MTIELQKPDTIPLSPYEEIQLPNPAPINPLQEELKLHVPPTTTEKAVHVLLQQPPPINVQLLVEECFNPPTITL